MAEHKPLQNVAHDHLREKIYSRELEFDVVYSETRLAARLSISRTPMRDALNRLNRERYIDILPNRGSQLHKPDESGIHEADHVRMMIERYCGEILAKEAQMERAQAALEHMQTCLNHPRALLDCERSVDPRQFWPEDQGFHFAPPHDLNISATSSCRSI